jgi:hypothetical protein
MRANLVRIPHERTRNYGKSMNQNKKNSERGIAENSFRSTAKRLTAFGFARL